MGGETTCCSWQGKRLPERQNMVLGCPVDRFGETVVIFDALYESAQRGELLLIDGGFCHWHLRRDGQLTIREIISTRPGAGTNMLNFLMLVPKATSIFAKCPADLEANAWYEKKGFMLENTEITKTSRKVNWWRLIIQS